MDLRNKVIIHEVFGTGKIISNKDGYLTIQFKDKKKNFVFPDAFESFLRFKNRKDIELLLPTIKEKFKIKQKEREEHEELIIKERMLRLETYRAEDSTKKKSKSRSSMRDSSNLAFRFNYCDGGKSTGQVGFNGVCSDYILKKNIEHEKNIWCKSEDSLCMKYYNNEITREVLDNIFEKKSFVCYESQMLRDWKAYAGTVRRGENKGKAKKIGRTYKNTLCILTTCDHGEEEDSRYIFAVFLIDETFKGNNKQEGYVGAHSKYKIKLSKDEANKLLFWNYYANSTSPHKVLWNSGLFRYFHNNQAAQILRDIVEIKKDTEDEELAKEFYQYFCDLSKIDIETLGELNGALRQVEFSK